LDWRGASRGAGKRSDSCNTSGVNLRRWSAALFVVGVAVMAPAPLPARAAEPNVVASRYDVIIDLRPDGSLDVVERIALRAGATPITWFERRVPDRHTDGLTNVVALMDGREQPELRNNRGVRIRERSGIDVRWQFEPRGIRAGPLGVGTQGGVGLVRELAGRRRMWTALPVEHAYPIEAARVTLRAPASTLAVAMSAKGGEMQPATSWADGLVVTRSALGADDHIALDITFSAATLNPAEPDWAVALERQQKLTPAFIAAGITLVVIGVGVLAMVRMRATRQIDVTDVAGWPADEGDASAAMAGALLNHGRGLGGPSIQAAFFRLVPGGMRGGWKTRPRRGREGPGLTVTAGATPASVAPHEQWILNGVTAAGGRVDLRKLTATFMRRQKGFRTAMSGEMAGRGFVDGDRTATAQALNIAAVVLVITAAVTIGVLGALFLETLGPALLASPAGLAVDAVLFALGAGALSRLSESGERAAARWRARVTDVREVIRAKGAGSSLRDFERWLPLAIAAGIGGRWLKAFDAQLVDGGANLAWLKTMGAAADARASLAMMVAISGASHRGGGAGGGGGGAGAGGGSSGAG